jgi:hypothetical protein
MSIAIRRSFPLVSAIAVVLVLLAVVVEVETGLFSEYQRRNIVCNRAIGAIRDAVPSPQPVRFRDCTISASVVEVPEPKGHVIVRRAVTINAYDEASGQFIGKHTVTLDERPVPLPQ